MRDAAFKSVAVGFFDGVHLGHRAIIDRADSVLTFRNHPLSVLSPEKSPPLIMGFEERIAAIGKPVLVLEFTRELSELPPEEFASRYLIARRVVCGENWRFGRGGRGDAALLRSLGYEVEVVPYAQYRSETISSTRIRKALAEGELADANAMLGRPFSAVGTAERGKGEGTKLGFPTMNLRLGVYGVEANGMLGVANYGIAPTYGERAWSEPRLEVHFLKYLREERKFGSLDELKRQIAEDCDKISP